jgi:hypothetical protein
MFVHIYEDEEVVALLLPGLELLDKVHDKET